MPSPHLEFRKHDVPPFRCLSNAYWPHTKCRTISSFHWRGLLGIWVLRKQMPKGEVNISVKKLNGISVWWAVNGTTETFTEEIWGGASWDPRCLLRWKMKWWLRRSRLSFPESPPMFWGERWTEIRDHGSGRRGWDTVIGPRLIDLEWLGDGPLEELCASLNQFCRGIIQSGFYMVKKSWTAVWPEKRSWETIRAKTPPRLNLGSGTETREKRPLGCDPNFTLWLIRWERGILYQLRE